MRILIVDDEQGSRRSVRSVFEPIGHDVDEAASVPEALLQVETKAFNVAFIDERLAHESGLLDQIRAGRLRLDVIVITSAPSIEGAVEAMRRGAFDYLSKPLSPSQVSAALERVTQIRDLEGRDMIAPEPSLSASNQTERIDRDRAPADGSIEVGGRVSLEELEAEHIRRVVRQSANFEEAAEVLGIDPSTLYRKRKRLGF
jgi:DNA-binding NtrC family response regulator